MSKIHFAVAAICAVGASCAAEPHPSAPVVPSVAPLAGPSPGQLVAARQASMTLSSATLAHLEGSIDRGGEAKTLAYPAGGLARWAKALPTMFPPAPAGGSDPPSTSTHAKPEVWTDRAGFEKAADDFATATAKLRDLAVAGDGASFKLQIAAVHVTCDSCHVAYKMKRTGG